MEIRFISCNKFKIGEAREILTPMGINVIPIDKKIEELQTQDSHRLVKDKVLKAFVDIGRPLFVEHTGLYLAYLNQFPGGLTQIFWDTLQADKFSELFGHTPDIMVVAKTIVGYCDGLKVHFFEGEISGAISAKPRGNRDFQWDCVFIPQGYDKTFAELGALKNQMSMRRIALDKLANYLAKVGRL